MMNISRTLFRALFWLERKYYRLSYWPRHVAGILIIMITLALFAGVTYVGYRGLLAGYHGVLAGYHYVVNTWHDFWAEDEYGDDEYPLGDWDHYDFPVPLEKRHPKRVPNFSRDFDFVNDVHLSAATELGVKPVKDRESLEPLRGRIVELRNTRYYSILPLTSSAPFLVPRAADFLTALGRLMQEYNGTPSRFLISSVMRTQEDVARLTRHNTNASPNSTHCYGTTFDITYSRFDIRGNTWEGKLKEDLARALYDLQCMGYCYVKYEIKQPCFHVTVRP